MHKLSLFLSLSLSPHPPPPPLSLTSTGHRLFISNSGRQALLIASKSAIFLWELCEGGEGGVWWKIFPPEGVLLPDLDSNREAVVDAVFCVHPVSV